MGVSMWSVVPSLADPHTVHIFPLDDLIEHEIDADTCVCGPKPEFVGKARDGADAWLITHHSLDGREHGEE